MERLNLPIFREKKDKERWLTMNEYLRFVIDNLKYTVNITAARKLKKHLFSGKQFVLK